MGQVPVPDTKAAKPTRAKTSSRSLKLPIYLEPEVEAAMEQLAISTGKDVNDLEFLKTMTR